MLDLKVYVLGKEHLIISITPTQNCNNEFTKINQFCTLACVPLLSWAVYI